MNWHKDEGVNRAFLSFMDALVSWERDTGRGSWLLFIPDTDDEKTILLMDGKPVPHDRFILINQLEAIKQRVAGVS